MKRTIQVSLLAFCIFSPVFMLSQTKQTPNRKVDLGAFTTETMIMKMDGSQRHMAMWLPFEFYVESGAQDGAKSRADVEKDIAFLKPYITIMVQCGIDSEDGTSIYADAGQVLARAVLKAPDGSTILPEKNPPPMISAVMAAMKSVMASDGGASGANLHVIVFANKGKDGSPLIDAGRKGKLRLVLNASGKFRETSFVWNTPFDAIKTAFPCAKCKEPVSAKWSYCPWCGAKLTD